MKRKYHFVIAVIVLMIGLLTGCGNETNKTAALGSLFEETDPWETEEIWETVLETQEFDLSTEKFPEESKAVASLQVVQTVYDHEGVVTSQYKYVYEYDEAGNQIRETVYDEKGCIGYCEQTYDEFGNCIEMRNYDADGTIYCYTQYEYNESGNMTKSEYYSDDELSIVEEYEYDEFGNEIVRMINTYCKGEVSSLRYIQSEYDVSGNQIKVTTFSEDTMEDIYEYEYDSSNNLILETSYDAEGNVIWWYGYDYDEVGNLIEEISLSTRIEYEYDEFRNIVKKILYDGSGDFISQTEWTYE